MLLNQLFESAKASAAFAFGRFNPPHKGHVEVWNTVANSGAQWFIGTNPGTQGPKDPLPYDVKTAWMTAIDPSVKGHILPETSVLTLAASIYQQLGEKNDLTIAYVTDDQDWAWSGKLLNDYNGKEATHGYYHFAKIIHVPSPRVSSATALRDAARAGDMKAFYVAAGTDPNLEVSGKHYYDTVVDYLGQHPEKVKRVKKIASPVKEPAEDQSRMAGVGMGNYVVDKSTMEDASGVIATKAQAKDPRYSMSLTKDVRPGQIKKNLKAFDLADEGRYENDPKHVYDILKYALADAKKTGKKVVWSQGGYYKLAPLDDPQPALDHNYERANQIAKLQAEIDKLEQIRSLGFKNPAEYKKLYYKKYGPHYKGPEKLQTALRKQIDNIPYAVKKEQEVAESTKQRLDPKCWKGYKKSGTKMKGGTRVNNCVKIGESYENKITSLIEQLKKK